jgi:hypothetical protein
MKDVRLQTLRMPAAAAAAAAHFAATLYACIVAAAVEVYTLSDVPNYNVSVKSNFIFHLYDMKLLRQN